MPGAFQLNNVPPTVSTMSIYLQGNGVATVLSPQTEYYIRVPVTDANSLDDLVSVTVYFYYDADGVYNISDMPTTGDTHTCAVMTWTNLGDSWTIDAGGGSTTWSIVTANCSEPLHLATNGNFDFHFKPGKVATATTGGSQWHIYAIARDSESSGTSDQIGYTMSWYGEIFGVSSNVYWSHVSLGDSNVSSDAYVVTDYISNGNYAEWVKTNSMWSINGSVNATLNTAGTPKDKEFSLRADEDINLSKAVVVSTSYVCFDNAEGMTDDVGYIHPTNALWLSLGSTGLISGTYSGVVSYKIQSR